MSALVLHVTFSCPPRHTYSTPELSSSKIAKTVLTYMYYSDNHVYVPLMQQQLTKMLNAMYVCVLRNAIRRVPSDCYCNSAFDSLRLNAHAYHLKTSQLTPTHMAQIKLGNTNKAKEERKHQSSAILETTYRLNNSVYSFYRGKYKNFMTDIIFNIAL